MEKLIQMTESELCETNGGALPILVAAGGIKLSQWIAAGIVVLGAATVSAIAGVVVSDKKEEARQSQRRYEDNGVWKDFTDSSIEVENKGNFRIKAFTDDASIPPTPTPTPTPTPVPVY